MYKASECTTTIDCGEFVAGIQETMASVSTRSERVQSSTDATRPAVGPRPPGRPTQEMPVI